jgi:hypothetical protein
MKPAGMKLALVAGLVSVGFVIWAAWALVTRTPYWWVSIILGIILAFGLWYGVREQEKSTRDK